LELNRFVSAGQGRGEAWTSDTLWTDRHELPKEPFELSSDARLAPRRVRRDDRPIEMRIDEIAAARDAFARQAWKDAYAGFRTADEARAKLDAEDLERLAPCAYMVGKDEASADAWARATFRVAEAAGRAACCAVHLLAGARPDNET
jgi:hypothetical protein